MFAEIFLQIGPCTRYDPVTCIPTRQLSAENKSCERKRQEVAAGRAPSCMQIDLRRAATPNENPVFRSRMLGKISCSFRGFAVPGQESPMRDGKTDDRDRQPRERDRGA